MEIIPVIDLKAGEVVHARRGERDSYRPVQSQLCSGSAPVEVVAGLCAVHPFATLYIADLDAIQGRGDNGASIRQIRHRFPALRLWVDNGLAEAETCRSWLAQGLGTLVLGSEAQRDHAILQDLSETTRAAISSSPSTTRTTASSARRTCWQRRRSGRSASSS